MIPELHLFIIWEHGRREERAILEDLASRFTILKMYEIHWTKETFSSNLTRFYGTNLPPGSGKEEHVGNGPFLLVVVKDKKPSYGLQQTSKGQAIVNQNTFLAKGRHRELTGGGHRIHATNTPQETSHDLALLLGINEQDFLQRYDRDDQEVYRRQEIKIYKHDLAGAHGWKSINELFYVLNAATEYLVMRNYEPLPDRYYAAEHGDIDILTTDYHTFGYVANAEPIFPEPYRVHNRVKISGNDVYFDFRFVGDGYYDQAWQRAMLNDCRLVRGIYVPSQEEYFYSLLYHALIHKPEVKKDYIYRFKQLSKEVMLGGESNFDIPGACAALGAYLAENDYELVIPQDSSVYFNKSHAQMTRRSMWTASPVRYAWKKIRNIVAEGR